MECCSSIGHKYCELLCRYVVYDYSRTYNIIAPSHASHARSMSTHSLTTDLSRTILAGQLCRTPLPHSPTCVICQVFNGYKQRKGKTYRHYTPFTNNWRGEVFVESLLPTMSSPSLATNKQSVLLRTF